jgi:hypothetical protein
MKYLDQPSELVRLLNANGRDEWKPGLEDAAKWLADPAHFALVEGDDLGMFMAAGEWPGPLHAHVFFASRGKKALEVARRMLGEAFSHGATEILGETPTKYRDALMFARLLGFRPYDEIDRPYGKAVLSRLNKHNYYGASPVV